MSNITFYLKGKPKMWFNGVEVATNNKDTIVAKRNIYNYVFKKESGFWYMYINDIKQTQRPIGDDYKVE